MDWLGVAGSDEGTQGAEDKAVPLAATQNGDSKVDSQAQTQRTTSSDFAGIELRNSGLNGRCWTVKELLPRIWEQGGRGFKSRRPDHQGGSWAILDTQMSFISSSRSVRSPSKP